MLQQEQGQRGGNERQRAELGEALWAARILRWDPHYHNRAMEAPGQSPFLPLLSFWGLLRNPWRSSAVVAPPVSASCVKSLCLPLRGMLVVAHSIYPDNPGSLPYHLPVSLEAGEVGSQSGGVWGGVQRVQRPRHSLHRGAPNQPY